MPLTPQERHALLAEPHVASIALPDAAHPGRAPLSVPVWYAYEPGGDLIVTTARASRKGRAAEAAERLTVLVQRATPTYRYVSVEGPLAPLRDTTADELAAIASRYLPAEAVGAYVEKSLARGGLVTLRMRPEHWLGADLGPSA
ncbi:pyridoxamine 5'-phosphate oxidase family protein [Streptomyces sp. NPDC087440]|uniref:pyridoxamine 5'-phosphate oxidase family protein n=1 Tax=Streptomyces sp. NPDC087440 TaxID=3365790 RepID=UPI00382BEA81